MSNRARHSTPPPATPSQKPRTGTEHVFPRTREPRDPPLVFSTAFSLSLQPTPHPQLDWRLSTPPITAGHARNPTLRHIATFCPSQVTEMIDRTARTDFVYDVDEAHRYIMNVEVRVLVSVISLWGRWRVASFSHTPTPAESPSYPRAQDELVAPSARSGDRGVREWGSSRKARVGTCFFLRRTRVGTLSAWGARSARGRAWREAEKRASGRGASLTSQAAPTIAPRAQNLSKSKTSFWLGSQTTSRNTGTILRVEPPLCSGHN